MPRDRRGSDFTLLLRSPHHPCLRVSLFLPLARSDKLSAVLFRARAREGNTDAGLVPVGNFSVLSLTHRNPSTAIHSPPCLTGLLSKYRSAAPDDASTLDDHLSSSSLMRITFQPYTRVHFQNELCCRITSSIVDKSCSKIPLIHYSFKLSPYCL